MNPERIIRTSLQRTYIDFQEWAKDNNIYHRLTSLESGTYGFVYVSSFGNYYVIINKNITMELQKEVFCHEVEHILVDMPAIGYVIGVDMQHSPMEKQADELMRVIGNIFFG